MNTIKVKIFKFLAVLLVASCLFLSAPTAFAYEYNPAAPATGAGIGEQPVDPNDPNAVPAPADPGIATLPAILKPLVPVLAKAPPKARAVIAIDAVTGDVFSNKRMDTSFPVASVSKIMTVWLAMEKINSGRGSLTSKVKIKSKGIEKMSHHWQCGGGYHINRGKTFTVNELLHLALIRSSNAAAVQLGMWVSGSNSAFIKDMNAEAAKLGLTKSIFTSACGLNNNDMKLFGLKVSGGKNGTNMMSAHDVANLARILIEKYPEVLKISGKASAKIKGKAIRSTNGFLTNAALHKRAKAYKIDGLKTGTTRRAGTCIVATGKPDGKHRIITVILNDPYKLEDTYTLFKNIYNKNKDLLSDNMFPYALGKHGKPTAKVYR